ncbi:MAG: glycosyltransferase family 9 protein, partial [Vulcanimicrobiaceae bacterium]
STGSTSPNFAGRAPTATERVLIVRSDGVGDALALTPLLAALRDAGHELGALLSTRNADAFAQRTFAHVHVLERIPWPHHGSTPASAARARAAARAVGYDVALIASEEPEAYRFARALGIARRTGFGNGLAKPFKSWWIATQLTRVVRRPASVAGAREHEVETLFALGAGLHAETAPTRSPARLAPLILDGTPPHHGDVVLQWTPKFAGLGFDEAAFARCGQTLAQRHRVRLVAERADAVAAERIARTAGVPCAIPASFAEWKAALAGAAAVVTPDSGAAHVAGMLGVPCVDLFAPSRHARREIARWHPWAAPYRALGLDAATLARLDAIVAAACDELLAASATAP